MASRILFFLPLYCQTINAIMKFVGGVLDIGQTNDIGTTKIENPNAPAEFEVNLNQPNFSQSQPVVNEQIPNNNRTPLPNGNIYVPPTAKPNKWRLLIIGLIVTVLVLGGIGLFFYQPTLKVKATPAQMSVYLDNEIVKPPVKVKPGQHNIIIYAEGYVPYVIDQNIKPFTRLSFNITLRSLPIPKSMISDDNAFAASFEKGGGEFYYLGNNGQTIYKITILSGKDESGGLQLERQKITPDTLPSISKVLFSPDFEVAVFKRADNDTGLYDFKKYDLLNQQYTSWGADIGNVVWNQKATFAIYYYAPPSGERTLIATNRSHSKIKRLVDLNKLAGISVGANEEATPQFAWSPDGKILVFTAQGKLLALDISTLILTEVVSSGVTSVSYAPDSQHILYTQNGKLVWQEILPYISLTENPQDQANAGKIKAGEPIAIDVIADATRGVFTADNEHIIIIAQDGLKSIALSDQFVKPFYVQGVEKLQTATDLGLAKDGKTLFALVGNELLAVPLDDGEYINS